MAALSCRYLLPSALVGTGTPRAAVLDWIVHNRGVAPWRDYGGMRIAASFCWICVALIAFILSFRQVFEQVLRYLSNRLSDLAIMGPLLVLSHRDRYRREVCIATLWLLQLCAPKSLQASSGDESDESGADE